MGEDGSVALQGLLDRLRQGDREARWLLLERACERLRRLAGRMLQGSFRELARRHELDSVVHETWVRLLQALDKTEPPTVADFFRLAARRGHASRGGGGNLEFSWYPGPTPPTLSH